MKFNKNKAIAALSLALLLSTQTKPMGADFGIDAGDDIQLTLTEDMKQTLAQQAKQAFAQHSKSAVNALGIAKDASIEAGKSVYNAYMTNPGLYTGIGAGVAGAGLLAYKKPHVAGGIAAAGIAAGQGYLIAKDNPELVEAGKNAAINAGKAVYNYATQNAPVVYNALTNNAVADYIKENPEYVIPAAIAGAFGTYYAYAPVKRGAKAAGVKVANAAQSAAQAIAPHTGKIVAAGMVAGAAGLVAYDNQEAISAMAKDAVAAVQNAKEVVANIDYATYGQKALDATTRPAGRFMAKQASKGAHLVKSAYKLDYKKMAQNAAEYLADKKQAATEMLPTVSMPSVNVNSKAVVGTAAVVGAAATGASVYSTIKAGSAMPEVDRLPSTDNVTDINEVTVPVVEKIERSEEPVIVQAYVPDMSAPVESKKQVTFVEPVVTEVRTFTKGSPVNTEVVTEVVSPINNTPAELKEQEITVKAPALAVTLDSEMSVLVKPKKVTLAPVSKPAPALPKAELAVTVVPKELNPAITLLPGEDKAPELPVYGPSVRPLPATPAPKAAVKAELPVVVVDRELSKSQKDELNQVVAQLENHNVAQEVETLRAEILAPVQRRAARPLPATPVKAQAKAVRPLPETPKSAKAVRPLPATPVKAQAKAVRPLPATPAQAPVKAVRPLPATPAQDLMEMALNIKEMCYLNPDQVIKVGQYINDLLDGKADLKAIAQDLNAIRREAPLKRDSDMNVASQARVKNA